jgi:hypothetical protein
MVGYSYLTNERKQNMTANGITYQVGDLFTTTRSKVTGTIKEIIPNASGSVRVKLEVDGKPRWTTFKQN